MSLEPMIDPDCRDPYKHGTCAGAPCQCPCHGTTPPVAAGPARNRADVYAEVDAERDRQAKKWGCLHAWGVGDCSSASVHNSTKVMVLAEECGEVSRAVLDRDADALRLELVQVAAVAVAWLEAL